MGRAALSTTESLKRKTLNPKLIYGRMQIPIGEAARKSREVLIQNASLRFLDPLVLLGKKVLKLREGILIADYIAIHLCMCIG